MIVDINLASLKTTRPHQYAVRFFIGGIITAAAGYIAMRYGPVIGGLFLAFPAIFPASATLIESHEREKKHEAGLHGTARGRTAAGLDAAGTCLGAIALLLFAFLLYRLLPTHSPAVTLIGASVAWLALSILLWLVVRRLHIAHL
jgi:hypothetical protein